MALGTGIQVPNNFDLNSPKPLDARFIAANTTVRDAIDPVARYDGMLVYSVADAKMYQLQGGILNANWALAGGGGAPVVTVDTFTGNGTATYGFLSADPGTKNNLLVYLNGQYVPKADYSISGTGASVNVVLTYTIDSSDKLEVIGGSVTLINVPADGSVTTLKIADGAVTQVKKEIRAVHATAALAGGILKTASCGSYTRQDTNEQDVTNLTGSLVCLGNPVNIELIGDLTGLASSVGIRCSAPGFPMGSIALYRNGVFIDTVKLEMVIPSGASAMTVPPGTIRFMDYPPAGTHTYKLRASTGSASTTAIDVIRCKMQAYEI